MCQKINLVRICEHCIFVKTTTMQETINKIKEIHASKGWRAVYAYLRKNNIEHHRGIADFGLDSNPRGLINKSAFLAEQVPGEFRAHLYGTSVTAVKTGYKYNRIRAQYIRLISVPVLKEREFPCDYCPAGEMIAVGVLPNCGECIEWNNTPAYIIEAKKEALRRFGAADDPRCDPFIDGFIDGYLHKQQEFAVTAPNPRPVPLSNSQITNHEV